MRRVELLVFIRHLPRAGNYSKCFLQVNLLESVINPVKQPHYHLHLIDKDIQVQRGWITGARTRS